MKTALDLLDWADFTHVPVNTAGDKARVEFALIASLSGHTSHRAVTGLRFADPQWAALAAHLLGTNPVQWKYRRHGRDYEDHQAWAVWATISGAKNRGIPRKEKDLPILAHHVLWATQFGQTRLDRPDLAAMFDNAIHDATDPVAVDNVALCVIGSILAGGSGWSESLTTWVDDHWPPTWDLYHPYVVVEIAALLHRGDSNDHRAQEGQVSDRGDRARPDHGADRGGGQGDRAGDVPRPGRPHRSRRRGP